MTQPPPDYDVHETVVTETVTRPANGLSPTLRMLLIALGVLALLGLAWWLFQRAKPAAVDTSAQTPVTAPVTTPVTTPGTTGNANNTTPTAPALNGSTSGSTNGTTDATAPGGGTPDPTAVAPKPEGINPDQPLSGLNGSNPFKPSVIDNGDGTGSYIVPADQANAVDAAARRQGNNAAGNTAGTGQSATTAAAPVTITRPETSQADISRALQNSSSEPKVTISRPPTTDTTTSVVANVPAPTLPNGRQPSSPASSGTSAAASSGKQGKTTATLNGTGNTSNGSSNSSAQQPTPAAPIVPPIAGVTLPNGTSLPSGTVTATTNPGKGNNSTANLPNPGIPTVLDSVDDSAETPAATDVSTPTPQDPDTSALDTYLSTNQIALNAVVLGKVNTAILKTKQGFVVATVGQPITGSDVVLQSVTADSATLSVGNQTKTIPLDNKVSHE